MAKKSKSKTEKKLENNIEGNSSGDYKKEIEDVSFFTDEDELDELDSGLEEKIEGIQTKDEIQIPEPLFTQLPKVPLKVFIKLAGKKWDQMAGFACFAKNENLGPRSIPDWKAALDIYATRPVTLNKPRKIKK